MELKVFLKNKKMETVNVLNINIQNITRQELLENLRRNAMQPMMIRLKTNLILRHS